MPSAWTHAYFHPLVWREKISPPVKSSVLLVPWFLFFTVEMLCSYNLAGRPEYIVHMYEEALRHAGSDEQREFLEENRANTETVLRNPVFRLLLVAQLVFVSVRSAALIVCFMWLFTACLRGQWSTGRVVLLSATTSSSILVLGIVVRWAARYAANYEFIDPDPGLVVSPDGTVSSPFADLLHHNTVFTSYFLWLFSARLGAAISERRWVCFLAAVALWNLLLLLSSLLGGETFLIV